MDLDKAIKLRHSVRNFKETKKAKWEDVVKAIDAANYAPLAGNISTLRFVYIQSQVTINALTNASQQPFIQKASSIVVVCSDNTQMKRSYDERADKYSKHQAGAAIQNFLLEITNLGLASCWVGAFDDIQVRRILNIPENIEVEALLPVGIEFGVNKKKGRNPLLDNILFFDTWKNKYMKPRMMKE